jgi:HD-like signal output (HDOD) protein
MPPGARVGIGLPALIASAISRVSAGLESCQAPMIGQILRIIKDISGRADSMSVNDLVEFISSEPTTMGKVVSIASSMGYNSSGVEISSIHHAVSFIGFDRVRTLAISILLLEGVQSEFTAEANRELAEKSIAGKKVTKEIFALAAE